MKKNKKEILVITIMVLVLIIGITYAYFKIVKETSFNMSIYDFDITFNDGNIINSKNLYPIEDNKITTEGIKKEFTMAKKNNTDKDVYTKISLVDIELESAARDKDLRWRLLKNNVILTEGSFVNLGDNNKLELATNIKLTTTTSETYTLYIWIQETNYPQRESLMDKSIKAKIEVEGMLTEYKTIPNEGKLVDGMIPVIYDWDKDAWIKAGGSLGWYDYDNQIWANAVTVYPDHRNEYMESEIGTPINMEDINSMWVWIPRYKYRIPSYIHYGTATPPEIDVIFETGTETTGVTENEYRTEVTTTSKGKSYYTHPIFRDGTKVYNKEAYDIGGWDHELTGVWIAKFDIGTDNKTCNATQAEIDCIGVDPIIKPELVPINRFTMSTGFEISMKLSGGIYDSESGEVTFNGNQKYGLTKRVDSHILKNTEWASVAYLSQSRYGKMGNPNYEGEYKEIFVNSRLKTGRSSGQLYNTTDLFSYNGIICADEDCIDGDKTKESILSGTGASTAGTIYGIYDMNGGGIEQVFENHSNNLNKSGFTSLPNQKYYDKITNDSFNKNTILGDATWETPGWYRDYSAYIYEGRGWIVRGGSIAEPYNNGAGGIFYFYNDVYGGVWPGTVFRAALVIN